MALATKGEKINGQTPDPATLNQWLIRNGGFVDGDLLVWNAVSKLGGMHMTSYTGSLSPAALKASVEQCLPVVVNVRGGSHWVLVVGYDDANPNLFYVNDPGFNEASYDHSGMSHFVVYSK